MVNDCAANMEQFIATVFLFVLGGSTFSPAFRKGGA